MSPFDVAQGGARAGARPGSGRGNRVSVPSAGSVPGGPVSSEAVRASYRRREALSAAVTTVGQHHGGIPMVAVTRRSIAG